MKLKMRLFLLVVTLLVLASCQSSETNKQQTRASEPVVADGHNSQNALDWAGVYRGIIPCASCPGIDTQVIIHSDGRFVKQQRYIDNPGIFLEKGRIEWDSKGQNISLRDATETHAKKRTEHYYKVIENALVQLDPEKKPIQGDLATHYRLEKVTMTLDQQTWQWLGPSDQTLDKKMLERVNIQFGEDNRLSGQAPCNRYFATWQQSGEQLNIDKVGATKMACPFLKEEQQFFEQLGQIDNHQIKQNILLLKQGDEILLSFKAAFDSKSQ